MTDDDQPVGTEPPEFDVTVAGAHSGATVWLRGELDLHSAGRLRAVLHDTLAAPGRTVTLDVGGLTYADSVGLSLIVAGHRRAASEGGRLVVRDPSGPVLRVLDVSGLLEVLDIEECGPEPDGRGPSDLPDHLLVWLNGSGDLAESPVRLDDELVPEFSLPDWLARVHDGYPEAVTAVVFGADARTGERVARSLHGHGVRCFRGDTTPTSLADLRAWADAAVRQDGAAATDARERVVLVVSELAANVERHAPGWLLVDLARFDGGVLVGVTDSRPVVLPRRPEPAPGPGWRGGLDVVRSVCDAFGLVTRPGTKTVWATVGTIGPGPDGGTT